MKANKYPFILCLFLLLGIEAKASYQIVFGPAVVSRDTLFQSDTAYISTWLKNIGNQVFNGTISFGLSINGVQNASRSIFSNPLQNQVINIQPGDSLPVEFTVVVEGQYFMAGPDIFVVWPIIPDDNTTMDSLLVSIVVPDPTAIKAADTLDKLKVYCDNQNVIVSNYRPTFEKGMVNIYDVEGQKIYSNILYNDVRIPVDKVPAGVYVVEILNSTQRRVFRVFKL
jgi:hypothetical protein